MTLREDEQTSGRILQFACDCVSFLHDTIRDPWSYVRRAGFISSETKEIILNKTFRQPKTVTQLAKEIGLSQPAVYKHVKELLASDMMREARLPDAETTSPISRCCYRRM
jgi:DNA-binding MarR family transcriptional regulator